MTGARPSSPGAGDGDRGDEALSAFGSYLRTQRQLAQLTLRQLSELTSVSNPYLSQLERGLHQPSISVVKSIAKALNVSADTLLSQAAGLEDDPAQPNGVDTIAAIRADARLTPAQRSALISVYRSMVDGDAEAG